MFVELLNYMKILFVDFNRSAELRTAQALALLSVVDARLLILSNCENTQSLTQMLSWADKVVCMNKSSKRVLEESIDHDLKAEEFNIRFGYSPFQSELIQEIVDSAFLVDPVLGGLMKRGRDLFFKLDLDKSSMAKQA